MATTLRPAGATAASMEGNQSFYGVTRKSSAVDSRVSNVSSVSVNDNQTAESSTGNLNADVGPAYSVEISPEGRQLSQKSDTGQMEDNSNMQAGKAETAKKTQQDMRFQSEIAKMQQTDRSVRSHEQAHMSAGGGFTGGVSYVYTRGPDGKMYITGGEVPIHAPEGKTPEETIQNMEIVRRAALAPADPSGQDLAVAAAALQIESRARAAINHGRYLKQSDMKNGKAIDAYAEEVSQVMPTSMEGLIGTLFPPQGMIG